MSELTQLAGQMRWAATIIERANAQYHLPPGCGWTPQQLRHEAGHVEAEARQGAA